MAKIITGYDIIKGATSKNKWGNMPLLDFSPWHMISEKEKNEDWKKHVSDHYEMLGWSQVKRTNKKIIKNRKLVAGELDLEDYAVGDFAKMAQIITGEDQTDPLQQYYPLIPNVVNILTAEWLQKDNRVIFKATDPLSIDERNQFKEDQVRETLLQNALAKKQAALLSMGIYPDDNDDELTQQYMSEMEAAQRLAVAESEFKTFRTEAEKWANHVYKVNREKFDLDILEKEGFSEILTNSQICYYLDLQEDGFKLKMADNALSFNHKAPGAKFYSEGDYFGVFEFGSLGDVINTFGKRKDFTEEKMNKLKDCVALWANQRGYILPDYLKTQQGFYYDTSKKYPEGFINYPLQESLAHQNLQHQFTDTTDDILNKYSKQDYGDPRLFRWMRLWVRSQRKIGWLTKIDRSGQVVYQDWVDENFRVTIPGEYDTSIQKKESAKNLLYGEHVEWEWCNQWRQFIKISSNMDNPFWSQHTDFEPIYLDGNPCVYQFKGNNDPYDIYPPFEGFDNRILGTKPVSLVDRMKPWQIGYNICGNRVNQAMAEDLGKPLAINRNTIPRNYADAEYGPGDITENFIENIRRNKIIDISTSKEQLQGDNPNTLFTPQAVNLSNIDIAQAYFNLGQGLKAEALEAVGITRQRLGQAKAFETAEGIRTGVQFSESQTLPYFHAFGVEFLPRLYQRMIEATQYYSIISNSASVDYMNTEEHNVYLEVATKDLIHRDIHVKATANPRIKQIEEQLKQLLVTDNTMGVGILEKAEGLTMDTVTGFMEKLRKWNAERLAREEQQFAEQQETMRINAQTNLQIAREEGERSDLNKQLDRESKERVALITAIGREEETAVTDIPNALDILNTNLKQQQLTNQQQSERDKNNLKKQEHIDNVLLAREKVATDLKKKQIDYDIARENQTDREIKAGGRNKTPKEPRS